VNLSLACEGAAAVLHVYDRLALNELPRRYTVAPGHPLEDRWSLRDGLYDLWLLGPNGFHRHFMGSSVGAYEARMVLANGDSRRMQLQLVNKGSTALTLELAPAAYADRLRAMRIELRASESRALNWLLDPTGGWYDFWLRAPGHSRRLAGRVETGADSISDPEMGGPSRLYQER
ncbi:MAG: phospholipase domain-containing protein, partial [Steroidobacteraceae bacterium]